MLNDEIQAQYRDEYDGITNSQDGRSAHGEGNEDDYGDEESEHEVEFTKTKRENVFEQIDFTKRKTKIIGTIG